MKWSKASTYTSYAKKFGDNMPESYSYSLNSLQIDDLWKIQGGILS